MVKKRTGLGKGVDFLIPKKQEEVKEKVDSKPQAVSIALLDINTKQPRKYFEKEKLEELSESIKKYGILQPILVNKKGDRYEIVAGERRYRAALSAGMKEVPIIIGEYDGKTAMEIAIIENIQRADLNPIEEAMAYQSLIESYGLKQEEVATRVFKSRAAVTNMLRLLRLDDFLKNLIIDEKITTGHARALLSIEDSAKRIEIANEIVKRGLSVRDTENLVRQISKPKKEKKEERDDGIFFKHYEENIQSILGTKVHINRKDKNKGRIEIDYYSVAELERLMELIGSIKE